MQRPPFIVRWEDVLSEDDSRYPGSEELHSIGAPIGKATGLTRVGVHHEVLPPGRRTSFPHAERDEEELVYVLEGAPHLWLDGELYPLRPGDAVGFPSGTGIAHTFLNDSNEDVHLLVVGERIPGAAVTYPLHPDLDAGNGEKRWADPPIRPRGPHDGIPAALRAGAVPPGPGAVPTLDTPRLTLRKVELADADLRFGMRSDPGHVRHLLAAPMVSIDEARARIAWILRDMTLGRSKGWTLVVKESGERIGQVAICRIDAPNRSASVAYELRQTARGAGFAREAVERIVRFGFEELRLHRLQAEVDPQNERSRRLLEALGFTYEGILRGARLFEERFHDDAIYARLATDPST